MDRDKLRDAEAELAAARLTTDEPRIKKAWAAVSEIEGKPECPNGSKPAIELVHKYLDCSTACLPHEEFVRLDSCSGSGQLGFTVCGYDYGVEVLVPSEDDITCRFHIRDQFPALADIMQLARKLGCTWINFDQDGEAIDELPYFGW